ncbi:MAG: signal peptidase II [Hyphomicrobiaceae bacterium]|nr:signal peptidase II [Hyphomicrobiaceae bacterium]
MTRGGEHQAAGGWLWGRWSRIALIMALVTLAADQAHKWWMIEVYDLPSKGRVAVTPFWDWVFALNKGISYSMFSLDSQQGQILLSLFAVAASLAMWIWQVRAGTGWLMAASLGLIIGGAIGNAIDRIRVGGVIDYVSLHAFGYYWYVFNIADVAIVAGVVGLLYDSIIASRNAASNGD